MTGGAMNLLKIFLLSVLLFSLSVSCSRKVDSSTTISISGKDINSKAVNSLSCGVDPTYRIPGTAIITLKIGNNAVDRREWHCEEMRGDGNGDPCLCESRLQNTEFLFENSNVVSGANVELQVLLIKETQTEDMDIHYYGEAFQLEGGENRRDINSSNMVFKGTVLREGNVKGRFTNLTTATGKVYGYAIMDANLSPMQVTETSMFAGWFDLFFVDRFPFTYVLVNAADESLVPLFNSKVIDDFDSYAAAQPVRTIQVPRYYQLEDDDSDGYYNGSNDRVESRGSHSLTFGFFTAPDGADTTSTKFVDYTYNTNVDLGSNTGSSYKTCSDYNAANVPLMPDDSLNSAVCGLTLRFNSGSSANGLTGQYAYLRGGNYAPLACAVGGGEILDANCIDITNYEKYLEHPREMLFAGPYQQQSNGRILDGSFSSNTLTLNWKYLPDVPSVITGMDAFLVHNSVSANYERPDQGYFCGVMASGAAGVLSLHSVGAGVESILVPGIPSPSDDYEVILCPKINSLIGEVYLGQGALDVRLEWFGGGGGGSPTTFELATVTDPSYPFTVLNRDACVTLEVAAVDGNGDEQGLQGATNILLTASPEINLYSDKDCTTTYSAADFNSSQGHFHKYVSFKPVSSTGSAVFIKVEALSGDSLTSVQLDYNSIGLATADSLAIAQFGRDFHEYNCSSIVMYGYESGTNAPSPFSGATGSFTLTDSNSAADFWWMGSDPWGHDGCSANVGIFTPQNIGAGGSQLFAGVSANATGHSLNNFNITATDSTYTGTIADSWSEPGALSHVDMDAPVYDPALNIGAFRTGLCLPLNLKFWDNDSNRTNGDGSNITFNHPGHIQIFDDNSCTTQNSTVNLGTGPEKQLSFKITAKSDFTIDVSGQSYWGTVQALSGQIDYTKLLPVNASLSFGSGCNNNNFSFIISDEGGSGLSSMSGYWASSYATNRDVFSVSSINLNGMGTMKDSCAGSVFTSGSLVNMSNEFINLTFDPSGSGNNVDIFINGMPGYDILSPTIIPINP